MSSEIKLNIQLFGAFRKFHDKPISLTIRTNATASEAKRALGQELQNLNPAFTDFDLLEKSALADERRVLSPEDMLNTSANLAILPPVCGG